MRRFLFIAISCSLFFIESTYTKNVDVKNIGRNVSEFYVLKNKKNEIDVMLGKDKSSKGLVALQMNDLVKATRSARNALTKENSDELYNTEHFVVAQVANDVVTNTDIVNAIRFVFFSSGRPYEKKYARMMVKPILTALIEDRMRQFLARMQNLDVSSEVQKRIEEIAHNNGMSIGELSLAFRKAGIDMAIFKSNITSKLIFSAFYQSLDLPPASSDEIKKEKNRYTNDLKRERYKLSEIFFKVRTPNERQTVKETANAVAELLEQGFSFPALVDSVSQADALDKSSDGEWKSKANIEDAVLNNIKNLKPGQHSTVIDVPNGYKIVKVIDKAMPNKEGLSKAKIKAIVAEVSTPIPTTEDEAISIQMSVNTIAEANSAEQFRRTCEVYNFKHMEVEITDPDPIQMELINRNKATGRSGIIRIAENQPLIALFVISENVPDAVVPDDKAILQIITSRKMSQMFVKMMMRQSFSNYIHIHKDVLDKVIVD